MDKKFFGVACFGIFIRVLCYYYGLDAIFSNRPELITPLNSIHRVKEGYFLTRLGKSPYSGDVFHQPPIILMIFSPIFELNGTSRIVLCMLFIFLDVVVAKCLQYICELSLKQEEGNIKDKTPLPYLLQNSVLQYTVASIYLWNPFTLLTCIAMSTSTFAYLAIVLMLLFSLKGNNTMSSLCLAIAIYLQVYSIALIIPKVLIKHQIKKINLGLKNIMTDIALTVSFLLTLFYLSYLYLNSTEFLEESYWWIIKYTDLTPNIGLFWYFFIEVFERFKNYFLMVFHFHPFIYVIPLSIRLSHRPICLANVLFGIFAIFQAYPSMGNVGYFLTTLCMHPKSIAFMRFKFNYALGLAVGSVMMPVMWSLWLYLGSGNANFFYNQTLVFQIFYSFIITEFIGASMMRDKEIYMSNLKSSKQVKED